MKGTLVLGFCRDGLEFQLWQLLHCVTLERLLNLSVAKTASVASLLP